jgi:poly(beta-D-mannuronate) lyase
MLTKILPGIVMLMLLAQVSFAKIFLVHSEQEFNKANDTTQPGDVIKIANGTYTPWSVTLSVNGTDTKPITISAETKGKVIFTGDVKQTLFYITGNHVVLNGIKFSGCSLSKADGKTGLLVNFDNTQYSRMTNCHFEKNQAHVQFMGLVIISGKGQHNQIDHCTFDGNIDELDIQVKITKTADCPLYTLINDNLFQNKNKVSWKVFNGGECVQIGQDPVLLGIMIPMTTVRNNRFLRCNGEGEVISNKSSGNKYIKNYFENCDGELVMRGGHDCLIDSNTIKGGDSGIRINGTGHTLTNNTISGVKTGIRLMYGMAKGKTEVGFYIAPNGCIIKNNNISNATTGILIGDNKNQDWTGKFDTTRYPSRVIQDVAPANNQIENNKFTNVQNNIVYQ